jgi:hypothetical protein
VEQGTDIEVVVVVQEPDLGRLGGRVALGGLLLVVVFLLLYYKLSGLNAIAAMVINLVVLLAMMSYFEAAMTLPLSTPATGG